MIGAKKWQTMPCKFCGEPTWHLGTEQCDNCWEVRTRVEHMNLNVLRRILSDAGIKNVVGRD